jgi:regulator of RNase E activity RraB
VAPKRTQVVFDDWDTYVRETDDGPIFISFDVEAAQKDLSGTLTHCSRAVFPVQEPGPNGGPGEPEAERLWELEDELCETLATYGINCRLVGRLTHRGLRVLVFQVENADAFRAVFQAWADSCEGYETKLSEDGGWQFFNDCVRPLPEDWLFMADSRVIRTLIEAGSDPDKEHALDFVFQGEPTALRRIADDLRADGFRPTPSHDPNSGQIVMVKRMPLDLRAVTAESLRLAQLAEEQHVQYDGWGAEIVH